MGYPLTTDDICVFRLLLDQIRIIQVAIHQSDIRVLLRDFGAFVCISNEGCDFVFWMGSRDCKQGVAADVARHAGGEDLGHGAADMGA